VLADDPNLQLIMQRGSACGPVIVPVFKTGGRRVTPSSVGSTPTRFRHLFSIGEIDLSPTTHMMLYALDN
jgi:hypothetical protein